MPFFVVVVVIVHRGGFISDVFGVTGMVPRNLQLCVRQP